MKLIKSTLFFLVISLSTAAAQADLDYTFDMDANVMHVSLIYKPKSKGSTTFEYGNKYYGGMSDLLKGLIKLQASVKFEIDSANSTITFIHSTKEPVSIQYDIIDTHTPEQKVVGEMFRPIITDSYFFSLSHSLFLKPKVYKRAYDKMKMSVKYINEPAFPLFFSFAPELQPEQEVTISLTKGMDALVCGASNLHIEERMTGTTKNYIVLRTESEESYNFNRFMNYFEAFMPSISEFWGNTNEKVYSLIASPFLDIDNHQVSGTAFNNGFHIKYSGDTILANNEVLFTVSHEIMHRFTGSSYLSMSNENQWFNEGFTDYNTWLLLKKSGLITEMDLKNTLSDTYRELLSNPTNTIANSEILEHFWDNHDYERLPYQRGALFAAYINKQLSLLKDEDKTYQHFMRGLLERGLKKRQRVNYKGLLKSSISLPAKTTNRKCIRALHYDGQNNPTIADIIKKRGLKQASFKQIL
ncbi:hypothetical protein LVD15_19320 [Fulvivirga maritima]|uniref:M61 family metallopeptidase n=1 Tax=Fulvivirga maritima TaxID=2904247 RepID=UPI001F15B4A5|nr:M1 family aminopeptidase [Fulvivirga maritima]UII25435.1 hypothetical protein LVD15_19320 [Fulvivirga maritima]